MCIKGRWLNVQKQHPASPEAHLCVTEPLAEPITDHRSVNLLDKHTTSCSQPVTPQPCCDCYWTQGGATTTGPDAAYPPAICQNSGGRWRRVQPGVGGGVLPGVGGGGCSCRGSGGASWPGVRGGRLARGEGGGGLGLGLGLRLGLGLALGLGLGLGSGLGLGLGVGLLLGSAALL